jgi:Phosphate transporter family
VLFWVVMAAHAAIALGTLSGGWCIVKTMGMRITKLRPVGGRRDLRRPGLIGTALGGIAVSTTQTITGSIMGESALQRLSAVRWGVAGRILWAWILSLPASAVIAGATRWILALLGRGVPGPEPRRLRSSRLPRLAAGSQSEGQARWCPGPAAPHCFRPFGSGVHSPSGPSLRLLPLLIEPDVRFARIRLSDGFHTRACAG